MQWVDIMQLAKRGESAKVKFLSEIESHDDLFPYFVGMANNNGGKIIIGIDVKNYHLRGTFIDKEWLRRFVSNLPPKSHTWSYLVIRIYIVSYFPWHFFGIIVGNLALFCRGVYDGRSAI